MEIYMKNIFFSLVFVFSLGALAQNVNMDGVYHVNSYQSQNNNQPLFDLLIKDNKFILSYNEGRNTSDSPEPEVLPIVAGSIKVVVHPDQTTEIIGTVENIGAKAGHESKYQEIFPSKSEYIKNYPTQGRNINLAKYAIKSFSLKVPKKSLFRSVDDPSVTYSYCFAPDYEVGVSVGYQSLNEVSAKDLGLFTLSKTERISYIDINAATGRCSNLFK